MMKTLPEAFRLASVTTFIITLDLTALPYAKTEMTIRAGAYGNRNKSDVVFERIMETLRGEPEVVQE